MPPRTVPERVPLSVVQSLVSRALGTGAPQAPTEGGPRPADAPFGQTVPGAGTEPPGMQPAGPGGPPGPPSPGLPPNPAGAAPGGPPLPGEPPSGEGEGLDPRMQAMLTQLLADPKAQRDVQKIIDQLGGRQVPQALEVIDPEVADQMAQYWNSYVDDLTTNLTYQRGIAPGASEGSDEQLLIVYFTTPSDLTLDDIPAYANTVRWHLVNKEGMTDHDKIEDRVMDECFPLRRSLIRNGRKRWADQVAFVDSMEALAERWIARHGELPQPNRMVQVATAAGGGNPAGPYNDANSEALPPGEEPR